MIEFRGPPTHPHYLRHLAWQFLDPSQCREQWKCNHWRSNRIKSTYSGICRCASWCSMMHHHTRPVYSLQSQWCGMMWHHVDHKWSIMMCRAAACCTRTFYILVDVTTSQHLLSADSGWLTPECECQSAMKWRGTHLLKELSSSSEKFSNISLRCCPLPISTDPSYQQCPLLRQRWPRTHPTLANWKKLLGECNVGVAWSSMV